MAATPAESRLEYIDIGVNLSDPVFQGIYHGSTRHPSDLELVVSRAQSAGCTKMMVTGSDFAESRRAIGVSKRFPGVCYATVGVHPCSCLNFERDRAGPEAHLKKLAKLARDAFESGDAVAFGEFGLDYDRLQLCPKDVQLKYFEKQLDLVCTLSQPAPPLFLHCRAAVDDFVALIKPRLDKLPKRGLVHSFTGTKEEMLQLVDLGFDIGVNGCSMKTDENLEVVKLVPLDRLQIETDGPWCEMRPSHASAKYLPRDPVPEKHKGKKPQPVPAAVVESLPDSPYDADGVDRTTDAMQDRPRLDADGDPLPPPLPASVKKEKWVEGAMVKGRNEPATIPRVAYVIAKVKGIPVRQVCDRARENSIRMFGLGVAGKGTNNLAA